MKNRAMKKRLINLKKANFKFDFNLSKFLFGAFLMLQSISFGQQFYSCDMKRTGGGACGPNWDNGDFIDNKPELACTGTTDVLYANVYSVDNQVSTWNDVAITGHAGGAIQLDFETRLLDFTAETDNSTTEWGTLKVYYKKSLPSEASPGTQIGSDITSASDCQTHSITFDPCGTVTNIYIAFIYTWASGDNWIIFDEVTLTELSCAVPSSLSSSVTSSSTTTISWTAASPAPSSGYDYYYAVSATTPVCSTTPTGSVAAGVVTYDITGLTTGMTYNYWVRSDCGSPNYSDWIAGGSFTTTAQVPTITSFTPSSGCESVGTVVITGTNFGGTSAVFIGGTAVSSFTVDDSTQISAIVGAGTTGVVSVTNPAGSASSTGSYTIITNATITTQPTTTLDILAGNSDVLTVVSDAISWQWQFSEDGASGWSNIVDGIPANVTYSGSTTANLTIQPNTSVAGTVGHYKCVLACGTVSSNNATVTFVQYCDTGGGSISGIVGVTFGSIDNTVGNGFGPSYSDYSTSIANKTTIYRGNSYDLSVYVNTNGNFVSDNFQTVWIDWDGSGTFSTDPADGEEYYLGSVNNVTNGISSLCPLSITVPSDAVEGNIIMRVLSRYGALGTSCATGIDGEIEDYTLQVRYTRVWAGTLSGAWENGVNWTSGVVPISVSEVEIPNVTTQPAISSAVSLASLTIDPSADITVSSGSLTVSGAIDNNGTLNIGNATVNADGAFDGTSGTINMATNANANLTLSSTITALGTLNASLGTVTYDGSTQNVLAGTYNNLSISSGGIKTALGNLDVNGNLTTAATTICQLDMGANQLNVAGNLTVGAQNGLDLSDASSSLTFDGAADETVTDVGNAIVSAAATVTYDFEIDGGGWTQDGSSTYVAAIKSGATTTTGTGPSSANGGSFYAWFEASGGIDGESNYMVKTFDFSSYNSPQISFYYHMYGVDMGTLYLEINSAGVVSPVWTSVWSVDGEQHASDGAAWSQHTVDLSAYAGESVCQIRFLAVRGNDFNSDIALDDIVVSDNGGFTTDYEFRGVTINNSGGNIILASAIEMDGALTLTSGDIDASAFDLTLTSGATSSAGSDASHVIGTMVKTTAAASKFTFPLGDGTYYKSIAITPSTTTPNVWTAQYNSTVHPTAGDQTSGLDPLNKGDIDHISLYEWWDIDNGGTAETAIVELAWVSQNSVSIYADLRIAHFDGTDWDKIPNNAPSGTNAAGTITSSSAVSTYSPFTLASSSSTNVLPIELVSFSGEKKDNRNILNWTTASEINNAYFTVEKSYNGFDFEWLGTQEGTSPSTQIVNYSLTDYNILETLNYYRLKQTDFDGKFEYSNIISIDNRVDDSFKEIIGRTNLLGQEVDEFYNGIVIVRYKDGTSQKFYQFK